jgi:hypothetical protein
MTFDKSTISKAVSKTLYGLLTNRSAAVLILSVALFAFLLLSPSTSALTHKHIAVVLVLMGVVGVVILDFKKLRTIRGGVRLLFDAILIAGLVLEIREAAKSDKEVASLNHQTEELKRKALPRFKQLQTSGFRERLKAGPVGELTVAYMPDDLDARRFGEELYVSAIKAGWKQTGMGEITPSLIAPQFRDWKPENLPYISKQERVIGCHTESIAVWSRVLEFSPTPISPVTSLRNALTESGFESCLVGDDTLPTNTIVVLIWQKP